MQLCNMNGLMPGHGRRAFAFIFVFLFALALSGYVYAECGDNVCAANEDECTCAADCGSCSGTVEGMRCQVYSCTTGVCAPTLALGCCGNGICEKGETFTSCDWDCAPKTVAVTVVNFEQKKYMRGDTVFVKVLVTADSKAAKGAVVTIDGLVSTVLYDDGGHDDGGAGDGTYANYFTIPPGAEQKEYLLTVTATKTGVIGTKILTLEVDPSLDLQMHLDKGNYNLGDVISVSGSLMKGDAPLREDVIFDFIVSRHSIFHTEVRPDVNGNFAFERHTSMIDPAGEWTIQATARDANQNLGLVQKVVEVAGAEGSHYYSVSFVEPVGRAFSRGENIDIIVRIEDREGRDVEGAEVEVAISEDAKAVLKEVAPGNYGGILGVPFDFALGKHMLTAGVSKQGGETRYSGFAEMEIYINKSPITMEVLSPEKSTFSFGERVEFTIRLLYSFNQPVEHAVIDLNMGGEIVRAEEIGDGMYSLAYSLPVEGHDDFDVKISATDKYNNTEEQSLVFSLTPEFSIFYKILSEPLLLAGTIVISLLALAIGGIVLKNIVKLRLLKKRRGELIEHKKSLQNSYFNDRMVGSEEYYALMDKHNEELGKVDAAIQSLESEK